MRCAPITWLPGTLSIERGTRADYLALERFHYISKRPAVWAGVWRTIYQHNDAARVVAVGVLSYPVPSCAIREKLIHVDTKRYAPAKIRWLNHNLRTISRIIVHPQFRGVGLASELAQTLCTESGVRYVEAMAVMGIAVPFFQRAGMTRYEPDPAGRPIYYLWDRAIHKTPPRKAR